MLEVLRGIEGKFIGVEGNGGEGSEKTNRERKNEREIHDLHACIWINWMVSDLIWDLGVGLD